MSKNQQKICFLWKMQFMLNQYFVSKLDFFTLVFKCLEFEFVLNIHQSKLNKMPIQVLIVHFSQIFKSTGFTNFQFIMTCKMCIADFEGHNCMHIFLIFLNWKIDILSKTCSMGRNIHEFLMILQLLIVHLSQAKASSIIIITCTNLTFIFPICIHCNINLYNTNHIYITK